MRGKVRNGLLAAMAVGMAMMMTSCGSTAAPTGDALYRDGEQRYIAYATTMHSVIMAIDETEWSVDQGSFGASPIPCRIDGELTGYAFSWARMLELGDREVGDIVAAATAAFEKAGMEAETATYGEDDSQEINVIGTGGDVGRGVVTIRPAQNHIRVSTTPGCFPGDAAALSDMVFGGTVYKGASQRFPAFEGADWQPRFYFPEEGSPVYFDEDGMPIDPPPAATDLPKAPYGQ